MKGRQEKIENYIAQFNALETKLRNNDIKLPDTYLAAMLMGDSKMSQNEKENILGKVNLEDEEKILSDMKRKMKAIKAVEEETEKDITSVLYTGNKDYTRGRSRERKPYREDWKARSGSNKERYRYRRYDSKRRSTSQERDKPRRKDFNQTPKHTFKCPNLRLKEEKNR